jgi:hypothetical protein
MLADRSTSKITQVGNDTKTLRRADGFKHGAAFVPNLNVTRNLRLISHRYCLSTSFVGSFIAASFYFLFTIEQCELKISPLEVKSEIGHVLGIRFCNMV